MKRILLLIFALISLNTFAQLQVKEGSFKYVPNAVMNDKYDHLDGNDLPMALIKISTENISEQERLRLKFQGNLATQITKTPKTGQMWIYISAENATFINFMHPDYGTCKYYLPEKLCDFCTYEMVLQYIPIAPVAANEPAKIQKTYFIVQSDQTDALVYIDGDMLGAKEARKLVDVGTTHTYKIECKLYHEESGSVTVNDKTVVNKQLRPAFGYLNISSTPEQDANVWVDGDLVGVTPIKTDKLASGTHTVRVMKDMYKMKEQSFTVTDGQTTNATLSMSANFVNVTVNTDTQSGIYVDEEYKGKGKWTGRLSDGAHIFEARKENHRTSLKSVELVLGETKTITLDAPTPINGTIDVDSSPMGATIYIDGKHYGETPNYISDILIGEHELKLTKQGCASVTKTITIKEGETLSVNEKLQTGKEISISTGQSGDKIYVDGNYLGISPVSTCLSYGSHEIKAERDGKTVSKNIEVSQVETHGRVSSTDKCELTFFGNQTITVNGVSFTMIAVEGGTFKMGATSEQGGVAYDSEKPVHNVTLSDYYIGETEVTQELWQAVMGTNPSYYKGNKKPVEQVLWNDCQEFIKKLNQLTGKSFRLPTEAEWEYAARGGNKSKGYKYSGSNTIDNVAWYTSNSGSKTHDVKTKQANELGIYDMSGNVYEWCQDRYGSYSSGSQTNPTGPSSGYGRVLRGGGWSGIAVGCRVSYRFNDYPGYGDSSSGLRLAL
ncbi:MAG: SUMF1/EgtB/PvdO family nonheme iron enzyme [Bacteroidales bacterium]|nr:SUMF1/EgtB/PvdO family nonheme iron enzyme [Bacteroidales bacterium]